MEEATVTPSEVETPSPIPAAEAPPHPAPPAPEAPHVHAGLQTAPPVADGTPPVIAAVRAALGRSAPLAAKPVPPPIPEPIVRLVHSDIGLPELFAERAKANKMHVHLVDVDALAAAVADALQARKVATIGYAVSSLLERTGVVAALVEKGMTLRRWDQLTLDAAYDVDCGLTDVFKAVAETGSLVIRGSSGQGRSLSLVPPLYVAVVEPKNLVPDLFDLFEQLGSQQSPDVSIISGPSKTADIEMNLVTGVHGPGEVLVFVLR
jgi:L-lactate dehydrogenase complex protein LldG